MRWFIFVLILAVFGFYFFRSDFAGYEKIADGITKATAKEITKEKGLILVGAGGRMMDNIQTMAMSFECREEMGIQDARALLIYVIDRYLYDINQNKNILKYLNNCPFNVKNIEIQIYLRGNRDKIGLVSAKGGKVVYYGKSSNGFALIPLHEESYESAVDLLSRQD